jgi:hypothetical protein
MTSSGLFQLEVVRLIKRNHYRGIVLNMNNSKNQELYEHVKYYSTQDTCEGAFLYITLQLKPMFLFETPTQQALYSFRMTKSEFSTLYKNAIAPPALKNAPGNNSCWFNSIIQFFLNMPILFFAYCESHWWRCVPFFKTRTVQKAATFLKPWIGSSEICFDLASKETKHDIANKFLWIFNSSMSTVLFCLVSKWNRSEFLFLEDFRAIQCALSLAPVDFDDERYNPLHFEQKDSGELIQAQLQYLEEAVNSTSQPSLTKQIFVDAFITSVYKRHVGMQVKIDDETPRTKFSIVIGNDQETGDSIDMSIIFGAIESGQPTKCPFIFFDRIEKESSAITFLSLPRTYLIFNIFCHHNRKLENITSHGNWRLVSFICHFSKQGIYDNGHYITYSRKNGKWYSCNDEIITVADNIDEILHTEIIQTSITCLLYQKKKKV